MPIFESACDQCGHTAEWLGRYDDQDPGCCGSPMRRLVSKSQVVFAGEFGTRYNDPKADSPWKDGAHWAYRVRSSRTGKPEKVWIDNFSKQKQYCKEEGLVNPRDLGKVEATSDGMRSSSRTGLPGTEI